MKHINMGNALVLACALVVILGCTGWVKNVIKLSECDFASPYKAEVVHAIGLFPLVGAVTGWLDMGK